jgi:hypothetical protein
VSLNNFSARIAVFAFAFWTCGWVLGCGGAAPPSAPSPPRPVLGPLALLVPEGATTLIALHPDQLLVSTSTQRMVNALATNAAFDTFTTRTGIDPRRVTEAVFADYPDGTLILARGPFDARLVAEETGARMTTVESSSDAPLLRRAGFIGNNRFEVVALDSDVIMVGQGLITALSTAVSCIGRGTASQCVSALDAGSPRSLWEDHKSSHCVLYVPAHLDLPPGLGTTMLLSGVSALAVIATPLGSDALVLDVDLRGSFPEAAEDNFRTLITNIGVTELGTALGIDVGAERLTVRRVNGGVQLHTALPVTTLITGLRALFVADIRELLGTSQRSPSPH